MFLGVTMVQGIGVDTKQRKLYFTNSNDKKVEVVNLDDKARQTVWSGQSTYGLFLDLLDR